MFMSPSFVQFPEIEGEISTLKLFANSSFFKCFGFDCSFLSNSKLSTGAISIKGMTGIAFKFMLKEAGFPPKDNCAELRE